MSFSPRQSGRILGTRLAEVLAAVACLLLTAAPIGSAAPIHDAASKGDTARVTALIHADGSLAALPDKDGATPLHHAVAGGSKQAAEALLGVKAPVNARKSNGVTPLHIAASLGNVEITRLLIAHDADVSASDDLERTPLSLAMDKGRAEAAALLVACRARAGKPEAVRPPSTSVVFPKSPVPASCILHADLGGASTHTGLALTVLQGLVNREQPRIYLTQHPDWGQHAVTPKWREGIRARGHSLVEVKEPLDLLTIFSRNVKGAVIYESDLEKNPSALHKLNALTLYCSLNDAVPLTVEMNDRVQLPVLFDSRGRLGSAKEAYEWAYRELWPEANHNLLAFASPSRYVLRDYLVAHRVMPFWISTEMDAEEEAVCLRFMDESTPNTPVMGCWGSYPEQKPTGRIDEPAIQRMTSERGLFFIVSEACFNLSVHSGLTFAKPQMTRPQKPIALCPTRVYVCFNFTDGDNLPYLQHLMLTERWWADPNRTRVPLSWTINPCVDLLPDVLEYYIATASPNDELVCSTAGIGIASPSIYAARRAGRELIYDRYVRLTGDAMSRAGLTAIHLGDTSMIPWRETDFADWAAKLPVVRGILGDYGKVPGVDESNAVFRANGSVPVVRVLNAPSTSSGADELASAIRAAAPKNRPAFMHVSLICWNISPSTVVDALGRLGGEYVPVLPSDLFYLMDISREKTISFDFDAGLQGWGTGDHLRDMSAGEGVLSAVTTGHDPYMVRGNMAVRADTVDEVVVRLRVGKGGGHGEFFFVTDSAPLWQAGRSVTFDITADGEWHDYVLPVARHPEWKGTVTGIRLDPTCQEAGIEVSVDHITGR